MKKFWKFFLLALLAAVVLAAGYVAWDDTHITLTNYDYYSDNIPEEFFGYRILCIADYHNSYYYDQLARLINRQMPDVLLFLGDMTLMPECDTSYLDELLAHISNEIPMYGVTGNHESFCPNADVLVAHLRDSHIEMLHNEKILLERGDKSIALYGLADMGIADTELAGSWAIGEARTFLQENLSPTEFSIVACHRANAYPLLNDIPADLMLAGHLHGGIIRLPIVGGLFSDEGFLPDYDAGYWKEDEMTLLVSRGCDFNWNKLRVFNGPEVMQITLKR